MARRENDMAKKPKTPKARGKHDWFIDTLLPVLGEKLLKLAYRKASKRQGRRFDAIELTFASGKVSISPDLVGNKIELVAWRSSSK
jgi:hypothetical protein